MANLMTEDERKAFGALKRAFNDCLLLECRKRCPDNDGYEPKCGSCDIQHLLRVSDVAELAADRHGMLFALRWLVEAGHSQFEELEAP